MRTLRVIAWAFVLGVMSLCTLLFALTTAHADTTKYYLGDTVVELVVEQSNSKSPFVFVNLHENETDSVEAARKVIAKKGGRLVRLEQSGKRNITFTLEGTTYTFDPNRMFSNAGIKVTLKPYNKVAAGVVRGLAHAVRDAIELREGKKGVVKGIVVGLHNNTNSIEYSSEEYSFESYMFDPVYMKGVAKLHLSKKKDRDDFFYTTVSSLHTKLSKKGFSVVLEGKGVVDDGSLSVYARKHRIPYVNVEAQVGHQAEQERMIMTLTSVYR
jgi:hypothetical protein